MASPEILRRSVRPVFQSIVDLLSEDHHVVAVEALTRAQSDPAGSPVLLFEAAAAAGVLQQFDAACLRAAFAGVAGLDQQITLFVNVEPTTLARLQPRQLSALAQAVPSAVQVVLEVTERALLQSPAELVRSVQCARDLGWGIALDDVGAEPAGLALMPFLRPDVIKLDLALIHGRTSLQEAATVNAVRAEAERSGAVVLAEGIESEAHLERALALGARLGQGWLYGRPGPLVVEGMQSLTLPSLASRSPAVTRCRPLTPFEVIASGATAQRSTVPLVAAMSRQLEHQAMLLDDQTVVLANFQHARLVGAGTLRRYGSLARVSALTALIGPDMPDEPAPGIRGTALDPDDPLTEQWVVAVIAPHFAAALAAREVQHDGPPADGCDVAPSLTAADGPRRMEYVLTYDRGRALEAAHLLLQRIRPSTGAPVVWAARERELARVSEPLHRVSRDELPELLLRAMGTATNSIVIADARLPDLPLVYVNDAFQLLTGYPEHEALGRNCRFLQGPDTDLHQVRPLARKVLAGQPVHTVLLNYRRDGTPFWSEIHISPVRDAAGEITHHIGNQFDVTDRVEREQRTAFLAYHDELTGLPNRAHLLSHLELELRRARRSGQGVAAILFDLDGFKTLNDQFGHAVGDVVLRTVGDLLRRAVREGDLLGRLGGDEFLVILAGLPPDVLGPTGPDDNAAAGVLDVVQQHLRNVLEKPIEVDGVEVHVSASFGAALHTGDGQDGAGLIARADAAMYRDKRSRR